MSDEIRGTIGGGRVTYKVTPCDHYIIVEYRGLPADLLACGAVEPAMVEKLKNPHVAQYDSNGDRYRRRKLRSGKLDICRLIGTRERARRLPGVPVNISTKAMDWLDLHPGQVYVEKRPCDSGDWAWMSYYGTPAALDEAGKNGTYQQVLDGYQTRSECVVEPEPQERERTREQRVGTAEFTLEMVQRLAKDEFSAETQSRVGAHISAIMAEFNRELRRAERPEYLRLAIDNTKGGSAQV